MPLCACYGHGRRSSWDFLNHCGDCVRRIVLREAQPTVAPGSTHVHPTAQLTAPQLVLVGPDAHGSCLCSALSVAIGHLRTSKLLQHSQLEPCNLIVASNSLSRSCLSLYFGQRLGGVILLCMNSPRSITLLASALRSAYDTTRAVRHVSDSVGRVRGVRGLAESGQILTIAISIGAHRDYQHLASPPSLRGLIYELAPATLARSISASDDCTKVPAGCVLPSECTRTRLCDFYSATPTHTTHTCSREQTSTRVRGPKALVRVTGPWNAGPRAGPRFGFAGFSRCAEPAGAYCDAGG